VTGDQRRLILLYLEAFELDYYFIQFKGKQILPNARGSTNFWRYNKQTNKKLKKNKNKNPTKMQTLP